MTDARQALAAAQNKLTRLLIAEPRDMPAIVETAENVRRAEWLAIKADAGKR